MNIDIIDNLKKIIHSIINPNKKENTFNNKNSLNHIITEDTAETRFNILYNILDMFNCNILSYVKYSGYYLYNDKGHNNMNITYDTNKQKKNNVMLCGFENNIHVDSRFCFLPSMQKKILIKNIFVIHDAYINKFDKSDKLYILDKLYISDNKINLIKNDNTVIDISDGEYFKIIHRIDNFPSELETVDKINYYFNIGSLLYLNNFSGTNKNIYKLIAIKDILIFYIPRQNIVIKNYTIYNYVKITDFDQTNINTNLQKSIYFIDNKNSKVLDTYTLNILDTQYKLRSLTYVGNDFSVDTLINTLYLISNLDLSNVNFTLVEFFSMKNKQRYKNIINEIAKLSEILIFSKCDVEYKEEIITHYEDDHLNKIDDYIYTLIK